MKPYIYHKNVVFVCLRSHESHMIRINRRVSGQREDAYPKMHTCMQELLVSRLNISSIFIFSVNLFLFVVFCLF